VDRELEERATGLLGRTELGDPSGQTFVLGEVKAQAAVE
jgi:hypothetical protein